MAGNCKCGNELTGAVKVGGISSIAESQLAHKKDSAPWSKQVSV